MEFVSPILRQTNYYTKQTGSIFSCLIEAFISFLECMAKRHENNRTNTFFYIRSVDVKVIRFLWHCKMAWSFFSSGNNIPNSGDEWVNSWRGSPFLYLLKNARKPAENQSFCNVFRRHRSGTLVWNWLRLEMKAQK